MADRMTNAELTEFREVYGRILDRDAHGTGHYEGCWKDHWPCVLERVLDAFDRLRVENERISTESRENYARAVALLYLVPEAVRAGQAQELLAEYKRWRESSVEPCDESR